jgi:uncharacterized protein YegP (UPF0339 family)
MAAKFEIKKADDGQFYFNLVAGNGEVILTSEHYTAKATAEIGIQSVKTNAPDKGHYERNQTKNGRPYFILRAKNGEIVGRSQIYSAAVAMEKGIESVMANGPAAAVQDVSR